MAPATRAARRPATPRPERRWAGWFLVLAGLTVALLIVRSRLDEAHVALAFLLVVLGASATGGRLLGLSIAGTAFLAFNYFFLHPYHTLVVADPLDWAVLAAFLATSAVAAELLSRATSMAEEATQRADEVDRLAALGAQTLSAPGAEEALDAIVAVIRDAIQVDACEVYRRGAGGAMVRAASAASSSPGAAASAGEYLPTGQSLVAWAAGSGHGAVELNDGTVRLATGDDGDDIDAASAGPAAAHGGGQARAPRGSSDPTRVAEAVREATRHQAVRALLLPLVVNEQAVGVLRVASTAGVSLAPEQARLLVALAYYAALGVERVRLVESAQRAEGERRQESLRNALFTAVSHDLRTPLTTIKGIAHELAHGADRAGAAIIEAEADRMDALVGDLLDLSRIHAGVVQPSLVLNTVDELVGAALQRAAGSLRARAVEIDLPPDDLIAGRFDFTQALRALTNLLENAAKYTPAHLPIGVRARRDGGLLRIEVLDRGPGVAVTDRERIFEPFHRAPGMPPDIRGTGLGLSIARGLAEAQGGGVRYAERPDGGSVFVLELPAAEDLRLE